MKAVIEVEHLRKTYGSVVAVDDISFDVAEGEVFGLLGPNGAGKTTTVECLQGLRRPDSGLLRVLGLDPQLEAQALRQRIGSQLQESALPDPPREVMTETMQWVGDATPLRHVIVLLQDPWLGFGWNMGYFFIVTGIMVFGALLSIRFFRWE